MSAPALSRRLRPAVGLPVDEAELSRFRAWLADRGYAERTGELWCSRIRVAFSRGAAAPGDVDAAFPGYSSRSWAGYRNTLREFAAFREGAG